MKRTNWFASYVQPVRPGWYEVKEANRTPEYPFTMYFNGVSWGTDELNVGPRVYALLGDMVWRGLAAPSIDQTLNRYFPTEEQTEELRRQWAYVKNMQHELREQVSLIETLLRERGLL